MPRSYNHSSYSDVLDLTGDDDDPPALRDSLDSDVMFDNIIAAATASKENVKANIQNANTMVGNGSSVSSTGSSADNRTIVGTHNAVSGSVRDDSVSSTGIRGRSGASKMRSRSTAVRNKEKSSRGRGPQRMSRPTAKGSSSQHADVPVLQSVVLKDDPFKRYKPPECVKYMVIEAHSVLLRQWYCADVEREARLLGATLRREPDLCHPGLLLWKRTLRTETPDTHLTPCADGQLRSTAEEPCQQGLCILPADEVAALVASRSLTREMNELQQMSMCELTLVVFGLKDYIKSSRTKSNRVTDIEMEMAFTDLLASSRCDTVAVNSPGDLTLLVMQYTKAVAAGPYKKAKREKDEQADYYMRGDNRKCVTVDKDGHGLSRLWQQMVAVLPMSSLEVSRSVCAQYKSPLALYEALQSPNSVSELADIGVSRAAVPGAKSRRLGPEFAKKIKILFTAEDGDTLIE